MDTGLESTQRARLNSVRSIVIMAIYDFSNGGGDGGGGCGGIIPRA
jgi:hypothetical protein